MPTYPGFLLDIVDSGAPEYSYPIPNPDTTPPETIIEVTLKGSFLFQTKKDTSSTGPGFLIREQGNILGEVYIIPMLFDLEFITEDSEHEFLIWNADYENVANITNITKINEEGTSFVLPALPVVVPRGDEEIYTFQVFKIGPALQDTHYIFTINSFVYDVYIFGKRVIAFQYEINWGRDVTTEYKLQTIMFRSETFKEQRRLICDIPEQKRTVQFLEKIPDNPTFYIDIENLSKEILAIPIFEEPMLPTEDLQGLTTIYTRKSIEHYFNIQNLSSLVLFRAISDFTLYELKELQSVGNDNFVTVVEVLEDFKENDTVMYPVFLGDISSKKHTMSTDNVVITDLSFRELFF